MAVREPVAVAVPAKEALQTLLATAPTWLCYVDRPQFHDQVDAALRWADPPESLVSVGAWRGHSRLTRTGDKGVKFTRPFVLSQWGTRIAEQFQTIKAAVLSAIETGLVTCPESYREYCRTFRKQNATGVTAAGLTCLHQSDRMAASMKKIWQSLMNVQKLALVSFLNESDGQTRPNAHDDNEPDPSFLHEATFLWFANLMCFHLLPNCKSVPAAELNRASMDEWDHLPKQFVDPAATFAVVAESHFTSFLWGVLDALLDTATEDECAMLLSLLHNAVFTEENISTIATVFQSVKSVNSSISNGTAAGVSSRQVTTDGTAVVDENAQHSLDYNDICHLLLHGELPLRDANPFLMQNVAPTAKAQLDHQGRLMAKRLSIAPPNGSSNGNVAVLPSARQAHDSVVEVDSSAIQTTFRQLPPPPPAAPATKKTLPRAASARPVSSIPTATTSHQAGGGGIGASPLSNDKAVSIVSSSLPPRPATSTPLGRTAMMMRASTPISGSRRTAPVASPAAGVTTYSQNRMMAMGLPATFSPLLPFGRRPASSPTTKKLESPVSSTSAMLCGWDSRSTTPLHPNSNEVLETLNVLTEQRILNAPIRILPKKKLSPHRHRTRRLNNPTEQQQPQSARKSLSEKPIPSTSDQNASAAAKATPTRKQEHQQQTLSSSSLDYGKAAIPTTGFEAFLGRHSKSPMPMIVSSPQPPPLTEGGQNQQQQRRPMARSPLSSTPMSSAMRAELTSGENQSPVSSSAVVAFYGPQTLLHPAIVTLADKFGPIMDATAATAHTDAPASSESVDASQQPNTLNNHPTTALVGYDACHGADDGSNGNGGEGGRYDGNRRRTLVPRGFPKRETRPLDQRHQNPTMTSLADWAAPDALATTSMGKAVPSSSSASRLLRVRGVNALSSLFSGTGVSRTVSSLLSAEGSNNSNYDTLNMTPCVANPGRENLLIERTILTRHKDRHGVVGAEGSAGITLAAAAVGKPRTHTLDRRATCSVEEVAKFIQSRCFALPLPNSRTKVSTLHFAAPEPVTAYSGAMAPNAYSAFDDALVDHWEGVTLAPVVDEASNIITAEVTAQKLIE